MLKEKEKLKDYKTLTYRSKPRENTVRLKTPTRKLDFQTQNKDYLNKDCDFFPRELEID